MPYNNDKHPVPLSGSLFTIIKQVQPWSGSWLIWITQCCQKRQKALRRAASISDLLAGKILINSHSGVRGERRASGDSLGCSGWLLELTLERRLETPGRGVRGSSSPKIAGDSQCWVQAVSDIQSIRDQFSNYCDVSCLCFLTLYFKKERETVRTVLN